MRLAVSIRLVAALVVLAASGGWAQSVQVNAAVEKDTVYVGEPFQFQVQVQGDDQPVVTAPGVMDGFAVDEVGGRPNHSQSVTIINGRVQQNVQKSYVHAFRLTAQREGRLRIPPITVTSAGQTFHTQPVDIMARKPQESADFKLRLDLDKTACYVGEPLSLKVTWYISKDVRDADLSVPLFENNAVQVVDVMPTAAREDMVELPVNGKPCIAVRGQGTLDGRTYTTISFEKAIIPKRAGTQVFPAATAACQAAVGQDRRRRGGNPFGDPFFDDFFGGGQARYGAVVTPSNELTLEVRDVPAEGRPASFNGLIGEYSIATSASPAKVNVGDPITLTIRVSGGQYMDAVELPPLDKQPAFAKDFRIPQDMAPGKVDGNTKTFTQTIRAQSAAVKAVPPVELSFFDTRSGQYRTASSAPIPLEVSETTVVTAANVEGKSSAPSRNDLTERRDGIAHNYEGPNVLTSQAFGPAAWFRSPLWMTLLGLPPLGFVSLLLARWLRQRRDANPEQRAARRAHAALIAALNAAQQNAEPGESAAAEAVLAAVRTYLGAKLQVPAGALTFADANAPLQSRGVQESTLQSLRAVFDECMAYQYAGGGAGGGTLSRLVQQAREACAAIEKELRP